MSETKFEDLFSEEVWNATYRDANDGDVNGMMRRVARGAAVVEDEDSRSYWEQRFYEILSGFSFTSGGRIYSNCGTSWGGTTLMNCFASPRKTEDLDSLRGIIDNLMNQANTLKSEGGWGDNFSIIRPRGSFIHGIGVESPGAVKYMELFDVSSDIITSGSGRKSKNPKAKKKIRKGAMMGVLDIWHPDIVEFITAKQVPGRLTKFNLSVNCTDEFMDLVVNGGPDAVWELRFPETTFEKYKTEWDGNLAAWIAKGYPVNVFDTIPVQKLWNLIMESTYNRAEPGVLFLDRANHYDPANYLHTIFTTNPCVTGDTKLMTREGHFQIKDLVGTEVDIWNGFEYSTVTPKVTGHDRKVVNIHLSNGMNVPCTLNHKWVLADGTRIETNDMEIGTRLAKFTYPVIQGTTYQYEPNDRFYERGFYAGDGWENSAGYKYIGLYGEKKSLIHLFRDPVSVNEYDVTGGYSGTDTTQTKLYVNMGKGFRGSKTFVPCTRYSIRSRLEWLAGLLDSDGYKTKDSCLQISAKSREFLSEVQLLLTTLGSSSSLNPMKDCWRLSISATDAFHLQELGLVLHRLGEINKPQRNASRYPTVTNIEYMGVVDTVYCVTEPKLHTAVFNGFMTANCGEQTLPPGGVCDLGSMNLTQFVEVDIDGKAFFNFQKFAAMVPIAVRFLDNINDVSIAPLPEYEDSMRNKRRIGLGVLGWGSTLFMMKIRFASDEASSLRDRIMELLATEAYKASIDLACEKGMFKYCEPHLHAEGPFVKSLNLPESYMEKLRTTGIRNSSVLSIQPTGNTSIMANIVSGGAEPIFMPEYIRTVIVNSMPEELEGLCPKWYEGEFYETDLFKLTKEGDDEVLRGDFNGTIYKIDRNRGLTKEVLCEDYGVRWLKARGEWNPDADYVVTTTDLTAEEHLSDMQGFTRYLDSAMSKTINVPHEYPYADFKGIYEDAYTTGWIKGMTTYRAGTMMSVLASKDESDTTEEIILDDVKLPESANAVMKTIRAEGKKWYLTLVYTDNVNRPFGMFVNTNSSEPTRISDDCATKLLDLARVKGIPSVQIEKVVSKINRDSNVQKVARTISFLLRHGVLIKNITSTLDKVEGATLGSFIFHIKKFLQSYIRDGEPTGEKCGSCGGTMAYSEGCSKCLNCGSSVCG